MTIPTLTARKCLEQEKLEQRLACLADAGIPAITDRLEQLEREWSSGRMTKATARGSNAVSQTPATTVGRPREHTLSQPAGLI